jgi:hypothetical protein
VRRSVEIDGHVAAANPVPDERLLDVAGRAEALLARIVATRRDAASMAQQARARRSRLRLVALVLVGVLAIAVPAVAVARHFGLLHFSNAGAPLDASKLSLDQTSGWKRAGVTDDVRRLGERAGVVFYLARGHRENGNVCFSYALASGTDRPGSENLMSCPAGPDAFPSAKEPIVDLSNPMPPPYPHNYPREWSTLRRLVGVAADGVVRVGYVDLEGVVHATPVVDNLYATDLLGGAGMRAKAIVALDAEGRTIYTLDLLR